LRRFAYLTNVTSRTMRFNVLALAATLLLGLSGCDRLQPNLAITYGRVEATVVDQAGQPLPGIAVSVSAARPTLPYGTDVVLTGPGGTGVVLVSLFGDEIRTLPDTGTFQVVASRREPDPMQRWRDSKLVTLRFAPERNVVPVTTTRSVLDRTQTQSTAAP
jgi:hypothetical protein